jgi:hypothetical protein
VRAAAAQNGYGGAGPGPGPHHPGARVPIDDNERLLGLQVCVCGVVGGGGGGRGWSLVMGFGARWARPPGVCVCARVFLCSGGEGGGVLHGCVGGCAQARAARRVCGLLTLRHACAHTPVPTRLCPPTIHARVHRLRPQLTLKCADLGHTAAPLPVHLRWVASLEEEFFRQVWTGV